MDIIVDFNLFLVDEYWSGQIEGIVQKKGLWDKSNLMSSPIAKGFKETLQGPLPVAICSTIR